VNNLIGADYVLPMTGDNAVIKDGAVVENGRLTNGDLRELIARVNTRVSGLFERRERYFRHLRQHVIVSNRIGKDQVAEPAKGDLFRVFGLSERQNEIDVAGSLQLKNIVVRRPTQIEFEIRKRSFESTQCGRNRDIRNGVVDRHGELGRNSRT
jgi:hypothetical protein